MLCRQAKQRRRLQGLKSRREQIKEAELSLRWDSLLIYLHHPFYTFDMAGLTWRVRFFFPLILRNNRPMDYTSERKKSSTLLDSWTHWNNKTHKRRCKLKSFHFNLGVTSPGIVFNRRCHARNNFRMCSIFLANSLLTTPGTDTRTTPDVASFGNEAREQMFLESTHFIRPSSIFHRHARNDAISRIWRRE